MSFTAYPVLNLPPPHSWRRVHTLARGGEPGKSDGSDISGRPPPIPHPPSAAFPWIGGGACMPWLQYLPRAKRLALGRSEEHTSELQSLMRISYAVFCLKKKKKELYQTNNT